MEKCLIIRVHPLIATFDKIRSLYLSSGLTPISDRNRKGPFILWKLSVLENSQ